MDHVLPLLAVMLLTLFTGICNSLLSFLLDYCFLPGEIFSGWLPFLARKCANKKKLEDLDKRRLLYRLSDEVYETQLFELCDGKFFFKILGGCIICSNIWLSFVTFALLHFLLPFDLSWWFMLVHTLISSAFLRKFLIDRS